MACSQHDLMSLVSTSVVATLSRSAYEVCSSPSCVPGWGGLGMIGGGAVQSPLVHVVDHVPHGWLFPRCAAAVHHGGAGTTAASTAAGIPTGIVPFFGDQPYWGGMCWCVWWKARDNLKQWLPFSKACLASHRSMDRRLVQ